MASNSLEDQYRREYQIDPIGSGKKLIRDLSKCLSELSDSSMQRTRDLYNSEAVTWDPIETGGMFMDELVEHKKVLDTLLSIADDLYERSRSSDALHVTNAWDMFMQRIGTLQHVIKEWTWIDTEKAYPKPTEQPEKVNGGWDHVCKKPKPKKRKIGRVWTCRCGKSWQVQGPKVSPTVAENIADHILLYVTISVGGTGWVEYDPE